jgi:hypothetical protein
MEAQLVQTYLSSVYTVSKLLSKLMYNMVNWFIITTSLSFILHLH